MASWLPAAVFALASVLASAAGSPVWAQADAAAIDGQTEPERTRQALEAMQAEPDGVKCRWEAPSRVVAITTASGHIDRLRRALRDLEVVDDDGRWVAGDAHVVHLGNAIGFGSDILGTLEYMKSLDDQARAAGGRLHPLLGMTEMVALRGRGSHVKHEQYEPLRTEVSDEKLQAYIEKRMEEFREYVTKFPASQRDKLIRNYSEKIERQHAPGWVEFTERLAPGTELGDWLRSANAVIEIGDVVYVSGGIHEDYADIPIEKINAYYRDKVNRDFVWVADMADSDAGPVEWRGMAADPAYRSTDKVVELLDELDARSIVVGNAPAPRAGAPRCVQLGYLIFVESRFWSPNDLSFFNGVVIESDTVKLRNEGQTIERPLPSKPS